MLDDAVPAVDEPAEIEVLPLRPVLPARPSKCPRAPCLKRSGSGSSDFSGSGHSHEGSSSSTGSMSASISSLSMTPVDPLSSAMCSNTSFRSFRGSTPQAQRQVRFDESDPETGVTHSGTQYDRTPIESTQCKGSSMDLSMRRCTTKTVEGDEEVDVAEDELDIRSPLAAKVAASDYFGSWTQLRAGSVIGYEKSASLPNTPSADEPTTTSLPTHSFRCFGGLTNDSLASNDKEPEEGSKEIIASPDPDLRSADATPMPSPSVAKSLAMNKCYFQDDEEEEPLFRTERVDSSSRDSDRPSLKIQIAAPESTTLDTLSLDDTPTQTRTKPLVTAKGKPSAMRELAIPNTASTMVSPERTVTAMNFKQLDLVIPPQQSVDSSMLDSTSETTTSTMTFASDQDSPPLSWLSGSSGCTSPELLAPSFSVGMGRSLSADSIRETKKHESTLMHLQNVNFATRDFAQHIRPKLSGANVAELSIKPFSIPPAEISAERFADRLALADEASSSGYSSSSPMVSTDDEGQTTCLGIRRLLSRSCNGAVSNANRSLSEDFLRSADECHSGASSDASPNTEPENFGSTRHGGNSSLPAGMIKKKKKTKSSHKSSAFCVASLDDTGVLGGF